jgi:hypothetical protein
MVMGILNRDDDGAYYEMEIMELKDEIEHQKHEIAGLNNKINLLESYIERENRI